MIATINDCNGFTHSITVSLFIDTDEVAARGNAKVFIIAVDIRRCCVFRAVYSNNDDCNTFNRVLCFGYINDCPRDGAALLWEAVLCKDDASRYKDAYKEINAKFKRVIELSSLE